MMTSRRFILGLFLLGLYVFYFPRSSGNNLRPTGIPLQLFTKSKQIVSTPSLQVSMNKFCNGCKPPEVFDDKKAVAFIADNPLDFISEPMVKWMSYPDDWNGGVGRSEFFRFYYLYVKGGIYLDHDAVLASDVSNFVKERDFIGVNAWTPTGIPYMMAGFIAAKPHHPLIKTALITLYDADASMLKGNYLYTCEVLLRIFHKENYASDKNILLEELYEHGKHYSGTTIVEKGRKCVARHMFRVGDGGSLDNMEKFLHWMEMTPECVLPVRVG